MTAKERLKSYREIDLRINSLCDELEHWKSVATKATVENKFGGKGNIPSDKVGLAVAKIIDLEGRINAEVDHLVNLREEIVAMIREIPDYNQREILWLRYINGWTWEKIAESLDFSYQWVCVLHGRGLENISKIFEN